MRRGLLVTEWHQRHQDGRFVRLRTIRLVSLAERAIGLQVVELIVDGFAGLRIGADGLAVDPHLPEQWRSIHLRVQCWQGRRLAPITPSRRSALPIEMENLP